jgi:hypothetical protein
MDHKEFVDFHQPISNLLFGKLLSFLYRLILYLQSLGKMRLVLRYYIQQKHIQHYLKQL